MITIIIQHGPAASLSRQVEEGTTVGSLTNDRNIQAALGFGSNVQALINRRVAPADCRLYHDTVLEIETLTNRKARDLSIGISFGPANSITKQVPEGTTFGKLLNDRSLRAVLGFGENVQAQIHNVAQDNDAPVADGDRITVVTLANSKA